MNDEVEDIRNGVDDDGDDVDEGDEDDDGGAKEVHQREEVEEAGLSPERQRHKRKGGGGLLKIDAARHKRMKREEQMPIEEQEALAMRILQAPTL